MEITFQNTKFEKLFNSFPSLQRTYGKVGAAIIRRRLDDLRAATVLEDVRRLPGKYHELTGTRAGQIAVHVQEPYRMIFEPCATEHGIGPLNWSKIDSIKIVEIVNYHD
jgi:proteic killer suppression protein